jgi:hypothetical protein
VVADDAAADRAGDGVMAGVMAGDAADQSALEAAFGLSLAGGTDDETERQRGGESEEGKSGHGGFLGELNERV